MTTTPTPQDAARCYDNTKISAYKTCPRYFFIRHILNWTSTGTGLALTFGSAWHDAQDIIWGHGKKFSQADLADLAGLAFDKTWEEAGQPLVPSLDQIGWMKPRTPQIAKEMLWEYTAKHYNMIQNCTVLGIEQPFAVPVPKMENVWYVGRLDKAIEYNSQRLVLEHKTTTAYATIGNFRQDYVESWYMASQIMGYQFGGSLFYGSIDAVWVDAALVHQKIHNAFKFIPVAHNYTLLEEWLLGTKVWIDDIIQETKAFQAAGKLTPGMFKKNTESCFGKYGPCAFIDICRSVADPTTLDGPPPGYIEEKWEPFDVLGLNKLIKETSDA